MNTKRSIARQIHDIAYAKTYYSRPPKAELEAYGGVCTYSSNDGNHSGWSFSPTEEWEFPDGSVIEIGYSAADVLSRHART